MIDPESLIAGLFLGIAIGMAMGRSDSNANWREKAEDGTGMESKGALYRVMRLPPHA